MQQPLVSISLLLYRPGFYLKPCLESLSDQTYKNWELLVIDNNSGDGTFKESREILKGLADLGRNVPAWRIIENKKNLGYAAGHNQGIKESRGELVFLLNQDIILRSDFIEKIIGVFGKDKQISSVQGKLLRLKTAGECLIKTKIIDNAGLVIFKNRRIIARGQGHDDEEQFSEPEEIFGVDGAAPVYRRQALEDIKICLDGKCEYLDEDFFMYKEDVDLAWRLRLAGWKAFYEPRAVAWHARTAGDSAARSYLEIIRERKKINKFAKCLAFRNQRLMQIKNDQFWLLLKHSIYFLPKEIASWLYVALFERNTWRAIKDLLMQSPKAWRKREIIKENKKTGQKEIERWFS